MICIIRYDIRINKRDLDIVKPRYKLIIIKVNDNIDAFFIDINLLAIGLNFFRGWSLSTSQSIISLNI